MISEQNARELIALPESDRLEKTVSTTNTDKFGEAVCAFANDLAGSGAPGHLLIGVEDDGRIAGLRLSDEQMRNFAGIRADGNLLPSPTMTVSKFSFPEGDVAVLEVMPSKNLPVRYRGRIWVRVGPRKAVANEAEERTLRERQKTYGLTFDATPRFDAAEDDLRMDVFKNHYLPRAVDAKALAEDSRPLKQKMAALRFYDATNDCPTNAGLLLFGKNPEYFFFGGYLQYVKFDGGDNGAPILSEFKFTGNLVEMLVKLDAFIETTIAERKPVPASALREEPHIAYPHWAVRELVLNAVMHRDYQANAPIKFYEYADRVEVTNPGGLYGLARPENFPNVNDYRNPVLAEALKILGYVNRFNRGIALAQREFDANGNGRIEFDVDKHTVFCCRVTRSEFFPFEESAAARNSADAEAGKNAVVEKRSRGKKGKKSAEKILDAVRKNPQVTADELMTLTRLTRRGVEWNLKRLCTKKILTRIGSKKTGYWQILPETSLPKTVD